jgi:hypothetical protein
MKNREIAKYFDVLEHRYSGGVENLIALKFGPSTHSIYRHPK